MEELTMAKKKALTKKLAMRWPKKAVKKKTSSKAASKPTKKQAKAAKKPVAKKVAKAVAKKPVPAATSKVGKKTPIAKSGPSKPQARPKGPPTQLKLHEEPTLPAMDVLPVAPQPETTTDSNSGLPF
jgi:hypothetical protein